MDTHLHKQGLAGVVALMVMFVASGLAATVIWLLTTRSDDLFAVLASAEGIWDIVDAVARRVLAII